MPGARHDRADRSGALPDVREADQAKGDAENLPGHGNQDAPVNQTMISGQSEMLLLVLRFG